MSLTTRIAGSMAALIVLVLSCGCKTIERLRDLNPQLGKAVTNVTDLNLVLEGTAGFQQPSPSAPHLATGSNQVGLTENLRTVSKAVTNVTGTMIPMESALRQVGGSLTNLSIPMTAMAGQLNTLSNSMNGLNTPLTDLSNKVSDIRSELTLLKTNLVQLGSGLGALHGQIGGDSRNVNTNLPATGLVGRLIQTEVALASNTVAIAQVNASLTANNRLLGESTKALKGFDRLEKLLPLLAAMLALMGTLWTAISLGNDARKSVWDKLNGMGVDPLNTAWDEYEAGRVSPNSKNLKSAIMSVGDFRDAYAYSMFQLLVAGLITVAFFWEVIIADFSLLITLPFLFTAGFVSLVVLYTGDQRDVQLMFNGRWPLKKPCPIYWFCPLLDDSSGSSNLVCKLAKFLFFLILLIFFVGMIVLVTLRVSEKLKSDKATAPTAASIADPAFRDLARHSPGDRLSQP